MRTRLMIPLALALALPANSQEPSTQSPILQKLASRQRQAAQQLTGLLDKIEILKKDLLRRDEKAKADLLDRALAIVLQEKIPVGPVAAGNERTEQVLDDLQGAMDRMTRMLEDRPDAPEEVQKLGQQGVGVKRFLCALLP